MLQYTCPHCQNVFSAPEAALASAFLCPHCQQTVQVPATTTASRWFVSRVKKKSGPYTWRQLLSLAQRGDIARDDLLLKEGTQQWVRAETMPLLFANAPAPPTPMTETSAVVVKEK